MDIRSDCTNRQSISQLQKRWIDWQHETWATPRDETLDLQDAGISVEERTVREWRKGSLPGRDAWVILLNFGWPLLIALMGDALAASYELEQEDHERRQKQNEKMGKALLGLMSGHSVNDNMDGPESE